VPPPANQISLSHRWLRDCEEFTQSSYKDFTRSRELIDSNDGPYREIGCYSKVVLGLSRVLQRPLQSIPRLRVPLSSFFDRFDLLRFKKSHDAVDSVPDPIFGAPSLVGRDRPSICESNDHASLLFSSC